MTKNFHGHCLCGAVKVTAQFEKETIETCHCGMCRSWGSGPFFTVHPLPGLTFEGQQDAIALYDSSEWAQRGFCRICGSHLFYTLKEKKDYFLSAGLFKEARDFAFTRQIFIDAKPGNYEFSNQTENLTEAEVLASV